LAEELSTIIKGLVGKGGYKNVIGLSSSIGKDVIPRVAGYFAAQPIGDITDVVVAFCFNLGIKYIRPADLCRKRFDKG
jgi:electron transfer flavoprotein alpha subunit